jgi:tetratricopeptide (TPR) repeat protein
MALVKEALERVAMAAFGMGWLACAPGKPDALLPAVVGMAGLVGVVAGKFAKAGPESRARLDSLQRRIRAETDSQVADYKTKVEIDEVDAVLGEELLKCFLDREPLVKAAADPIGFPAKGTELVFAALAQRKPELFGPQAPQSGRAYAKTIISTALSAAIEDRDYFEEIQARLTFAQSREIARILESNGRIEEAVARIDEKLDRLSATEAERRALAAEVAKLRATGEFRDGAIAAFITALGDTPGSPDQYPVQLGVIAARYRDLLADAERPRNLLPPIEAERRAVAELIHHGSLDVADARLAALRTRMAERRRAQAEEVDQERRDEAAILVERAKLAMTRLRYLDAAKLFSQAAEILPNSDGALRRQYMESEAQCFISQGDEFGDNAALGHGIASLRRLLEMAEREQVPLDWAVIQNNLGNALVTLGERDSGTARLEEAVAAYRAALEERTRERVPLQWAMTQNNLGSALSRLGERESGTARLEQAVAAYRAALEERTRKRAPLDWAMTQTNLGSALLMLGNRESGTARLEEAVAAYRAALEEGTRERVPLQWATTQNNLGSALSQLGERESGTARLEQAVAAYRAALEEWTRERVPLDWAMTQDNLGSALSRLGDRESGTARLEEAVAAYRAALEERTREWVPLQWAATQNNLGSVLSMLGDRESGTARLEEAVAAYRAALEERPREQVPLQWATTQHNLGYALSRLGERESGTARLEEAVAAYRAALEERTRERAPLRWAATHNNLGAAEQLLFKRRKQC